MTKSTHSKIPNCRANCLTKMFEGCLQGCSWQENPATSEYSKPSEWLIMSPSDKIYSFKDSQLPHWVLDWNIWRIFQVSSRMQLTGSLSNLWALQPLWMTYHVSWWQDLLIWRFPIATQTAELKYLKDPSSIFKDAVDGLFQQALTAQSLLLWL